MRKPVSRAFSVMYVKSFHLNQNRLEPENKLHQMKYLQVGAAIRLVVGGGGYPLPSNSLLTLAHLFLDRFGQFLDLIRLLNDRH